MTYFKMYSVELESFDKKQFINLVAAVMDIWSADVIYSGEGYPEEDESVCYVAPVATFTIKEDTSPEDIKSFVFSDDRETLGFLSYEYGMNLHGIDSQKKRYIELGQLMKYEAYIKHKDNKLTIESVTPELGEKILHLQGVTPDVEEVRIGNVKCNMMADEYIHKAERVLENIRSGHTYQLNLSMMFEGELSGSAFNLWRQLALSKPAPFYAYINSQKGEIVSTSPERFIKVTEGDVLSQPIKGTHRFEEYEYGMEEILTNDKKESAELSMIVDLIRNDISEHCEVGSVEVHGHKSVMRVDNLLQMYSSVTGKLKEDSDVVDLLLSASPGGSITGCPKKRSMEIIEELEPHSRGHYCGSIFRIKDKMNMDSSIAIRTGFVRNGEFRFFAGSGIVAASVAEKEYHESMSKAEKFLGIL